MGLVLSSHHLGVINDLNFHRAFKMTLLVGAFSHMGGPIYVEAWFSSFFTTSSIHLGFSERRSRKLNLCDSRAKLCWYGVIDTEARREMEVR
jgi:hypothetical protein